MSLIGELSTYPISSKAKSIVSVSKLPFFTSGDRSSNRAVIFIGGLWNGLMDPSYVVKLSSELEKAGWRFCQMVWSGNYDGFGTGSLDRDVMEMGALVKHLRTHCGVKKVVVMGHSTGSQDVIHYLSSPQSDDERRPEVDGGIMQAPASDREGLQNEKEWMDQLEPAKAMIEAGKGDHLLDWEFCKANNVKISAYRLFSLLAVGGDDDYFSNDLPDHPDSSPHKHPLSTSFGSLSAPALALWSEKDEFNTLSPDARAALLDRWRAAGGEKLQVSVIKNADHAVKDAETQEDMCGVVVDWLKKNFE